MISFSQLTRGFVIAILLAVLFSCDNTRESKDDLISIDVEKAYHEPIRDMLLSEVVEDIEYVKLETNPECLISNISSITISNTYITVCDLRSKDLLLFTRSGEFLRKIGRFGKGPGEYFFINPETIRITPDEQHLVFMDGLNAIYVYTTDGSFVRMAKTSLKNISGFGNQRNDRILAYQQSLYLPEEGGNQLITYDLDLNIISSDLFAEPDIVPIKGMTTIKDNFNIYEGDIYLRQNLNDTVFKIIEGHQSIPFLQFKMGSFKCPTMQIPREERANYLFIDDIKFTSNYLFITLMGSPRITPIAGQVPIAYMVFNRSNGEMFFLDDHYSPNSLQDRETASPINDLDGVLDRLPIYHISNGIAWDAWDIVDARTFIEPEFISQNKYASSEDFIEFRDLIENSIVEDNPIIRIFHLK